MRWNHHHFLVAWKTTTDWDTTNCLYDDNAQWWTSNKSPNSSVNRANESITPPDSIEKAQKIQDRTTAVEEMAQWYERAKEFLKEDKINFSRSFLERCTDTLLNSPMAGKDSWYTQLQSADDTQRLFYLRWVNTPYQTLLIGYCEVHRIGQIYLLIKSNLLRNLFYVL